MRRLSRSRKTTRVRRNLVINCSTIQMKKAPIVKLSLRKLFVAMLAVGPVAFLPAPLLATLPSAGSITVSSGSASLSVAGPQATITSTDRAVLNWGTVASGGGTITAFNIGAGETYNFLVPAGGSVLNKVVAGAGTASASDGVAAIINGTLSSNGRVFVLANGNINVGDNAAINTSGGLVLSTLDEATDLTYVVNGDLSYAGASRGSITIGAGGAAPSVLSNLNAWAGGVTLNGATVIGNVIINAIGGTGLLLSGVQPTTITGNLTANSYNGTISQGAGAVAVSGTAALTSGIAATTLNNAANDFGTVQATSSNTVSLADANNIALGASSAGNLNVTAAGNITTSGAVATTTTATLTSSVAGSISYATGSSAGTINAATNNGTITIDTVGNVTIGAVTAGGTLKGIALTNNGGNYTASSPTVTVSTGVGGVAGPALTSVTNSSNAVTSVTVGATAGTATYTSNPTVTISGGGTEPTTAATVTASLNATSVASVAIYGGGNYSTSPSVTFSAPGGAGATATGEAVLDSFGKVIGVRITSPGSGYTGTPTVTISGGTIGSPVSSTFTLTAGTTTYSSAPSVSFSAPNQAGGRTATGTVTLDSTGKVSAITLTDAGSGYTGAPTINISGGVVGGAGINPTATGTISATHVAPIATAVLNPSTIASLSVATAGAGYTGAAPSLTVSAQQPGGSATVVPVNTTTTNSGALASITLGAGQPTFTATPAITVTKGGTEAASKATAVAIAGSAVTINSTGTVRTAGTVFGSSIAVTAPSVTATTSLLSTGGTVTINATAGDALIGNITAGSASLSATGNLTQGGVLTTRTGSNLAITALNATLTASNLIPSNRLVLSGGNISINNNEQSGLQVGPSVVTGDLTLATGGSVVFGTGGGTLSESVTVGGNLTTTVTGSSITGVTFTNNANATATNGRVFVGDLSAVTATFTAPTGANGVTATGTPTFDATGRLTGVTITNPGSGYTTAPTVTVTTSNAARAQLLATTTTSATTVTRTGNNITDDDDVSFTVSGALNLATNGGNVVFDSQIGSGRGFGQLGQLNVNAKGGELNGNVTVHERTTIGIGNVSANVLTVNSTGGNIIFQPTNIPLAATYATSITTVSARATSAGATITQTTALTLGGGNSTMNSSGGTILDNSTNSLGGNVSVVGGANNTLVTNSNFSLGVSTLVTGTNRLTVTAVDPLGVAARNITILNGGNAANATLNASGTISVAGGLFANLTLNATNLAASANAISQATTFTTVNNTLTVGATAGAVALGGNTSNTIANLVVNETPGGITVGTTGNLTVRGSTSGAVTASAGVSNIAGTYGISLGNLTAGGLTLTAANGTGNIATDGVSGAITQQTGTSLGIFGPISATTFGGNITLANANNNFGRIVLSTGSLASGVITLVERDTAKIGNLNSANAATVTSTFGSIVEDTVGLTQLNVPSLTATANAGSINLGTAGVTSGTISAATLNASGAVAILSSGNLTLAASSGNTLTATAGGNLAQSGRLSVYGLTSLNAVGNITLGDAANNFGPISATVTGAGSSISITEGGTLNLRKVTMANASTGGFTAQSVNGDIVDSGLGGVIPGGRNGGVGSAAVSLTAQNGNIILDDPTTDIATSGGVNFNAKNVTLSVLGAAPIVLGSAGTTSVAAGNLTVTSATGDIANAGNITATGAATFQTGNGSINLSAAGNQFGSLRFSSALAGASTVNIVQSGNMNVLTGSTAVGGVTLASGGNITVSNSGGGVVSFGGTALLSATGSITLPKLVQAVGTITVNAGGTKDLSALSLAGDLGSKAPVSFGAGSYLPPSP